MTLDDDRFTQVSGHIIHQEKGFFTFVEAREYIRELREELRRAEDLHKALLARAREMGILENEAYALTTEVSRRRHIVAEQFYERATRRSSLRSRRSPSLPPRRRSGRRRSRSVPSTRSRRG